jgi:hypothetical protein
VTVRQRPLALKASDSDLPLTSLAVELAAERGSTLVGFPRERSMNLYTGVHRVAVTSEPVAAS